MKIQIIIVSFVCTLYSCSDFFNSSKNSSKSSQARTDQNSVDPASAGGQEQGRDPSSPGQAPISFGIKHISMGNHHTCVLLTDSRVKCWGYNGNGELGLGDNVNRGDQPNQMGQNLPFVNLGDPSIGIKKIYSAGFYGHSWASDPADSYNCALFENGKIKCWGSNAHGQLGTGDFENRGTRPEDMGAALSFVDLGPDREVVDMALSSAHACALFKNQKVKCWGKTYLERYADSVNLRDDGIVMGTSLPFVDLGADFKVKKILAGQFHNCALSTSNRIKCWGSSDYSQTGSESYLPLGDDLEERGESLPYVNLGTDAEITDLFSASWHNCAQFKDGRIKCWGANYPGVAQLGQERVKPRGIGGAAGEMGDELPFTDLGSRPIISLNLGTWHSCFVNDQNQVKCWGNARFAQLGTEEAETLGDEPGEMGDSLPTVDLGTNQKIKNLYVGNWHSCVVFSDEQLKCWGFNYQGALGLGHSDDIGDEAGEMGSNLKFISLR